MRLRTELKEAIREAYAAFDEAENLWESARINSDGLELEALADVYGNLSTLGDAIMAHARRLEGNIEGIIEASNKVNEYTAIADDIIEGLRE